MHQSVDAAVEPDENTEVGDRLDAADHLITLLVGSRELFPGVGLALFDAQGNPATLLVHVENHHFNLVTELNNLGGMDVFVGPVHLRNVHQALDTLFDLGEASVVGDIRDLAEQPRSLGVTPRDVDPRIRAQLLQPQGHAVAFAIEFQNFDVDLVADVDDFRGVLDPFPGHVGDVQQAVDAAKIHKRTIVGEILDHTFYDRTFLQVGQQLVALRRILFFDHRAA